MSFVFNSTHAANSANIETSVTIKPSLTLSIPSNTITMNLDPSTHAFDEKDLTVSVGTNNFTGYKLYLTTTNPSGTATTNLTNVADNSKTIPNLTTSTTTADFPVNKWGYRISDGSTSSGNYGPFNPTTDNIISQSSGPVNNITKTLGFAAKVDYTKSSGLYELNLEFRALPTITQNYMQELTSDMCTEYQTIVIDKRDEQPYSIARFPDGNCWMTRNLNLAGDTTITNVDSNITAASYTLPTSDNSSTSFTNDTTAYVYNSNNINCDAVNPCYSYYSYKTITAGTNPSSGNASSDICPKGWRLPTQSEYIALANIYTAGAILNAEPFLGVYAGNYYNGAFYMVSAYGPQSAYYWSSTASSTDPTWAFALRYFNTNSGTKPGYYTAFKRTGHSVRCILKES